MASAPQPSPQTQICLPSGSFLSGRQINRNLHIFTFHRVLLNFNTTNLMLIATGGKKVITLCNVVQMNITHSDAHLMLTIVAYYLVNSLLWNLVLA